MAAPPRLFTPHSKTRPLQQARRDLALKSAIDKLDEFDLLILDDMSYVAKDQAETSVFFELISARHERRSLLIAANQPFGALNAIFPDPAMTLAPVDRLVRHAVIFDMNLESWPRKTAEKVSGRAKPPPKIPRRSNPLILIVALQVIGRLVRIAEALRDEQSMGGSRPRDRKARPSVKPHPLGAFCGRRLDPERLRNLLPL